MKAKLAGCALALLLATFTWTSLSIPASAQPLPQATPTPEIHAPGHASPPQPAPDTLGPEGAAGAAVEIAPAEQAPAGFAPPADALDQPPTVETPYSYVLDGKQKLVAAVRLDSGKILGKTPLEGEPERMLLSPDASRLLVLDRGPGKITLRFGYHPKGKSIGTLIDTRTMQVMSRVELGWNVDHGIVFGYTYDPWIFSINGRQVVLYCQGYRSQKPEENLPIELVRLDLGSGEIAGRLGLKRRHSVLLPTPDGLLAVAFFQRETPKKQRPIPAQADFIDLRGPRLLGTLELEGDPTSVTLSPDGEYLYALEPGKPDKKPEKNINGRLQVISVASRSHRLNLDVGADPRGLVVDDAGNQLLVLADGPRPREGDAPGQLLVIRGEDLAARIEVGHKPLFAQIAPNPEKLYVVSERTLTDVDLLALRALGQMALDPAGISLLTAASPDHTVSELAISEDGKRGLALFTGSSRATVIDLEKRKTVAEVNTGRGGVKFGKFLGALAMTAASAYVGASTAQATGSSYYTYNIYGVAPARTSLEMSLDGKLAYVLNTHSNDVTIINTDDASVVTKIGIGTGDPKALRLLSGGEMVAASAGSTLHLIEVAKNLKVAEVEVGTGFQIAPDGQHAAAVHGSALACLSGRSGKRVATATGFEQVSQVLFAAEPGTRPAQVERRRWAAAPAPVEPAAPLPPAEAAAPDAVTPASIPAPEAPVLAEPATEPAPPVAPAAEPPTPVSPAPPPVAAPGVGELRILASPWAEVTVDGQPVGTTPFAPLRLATGTHKVVLTNPGFQPLLKKVEVKAGEMTTLQVDLEQEAFPK